jgi:hypothetical protein
MQSSWLIPFKFDYIFFSKMPGSYIAALCTGQTLKPITEHLINSATFQNYRQFTGSLFIPIGTKPPGSYLPLFYKNKAKTNNMDQCLSSTIKRLQQIFPFAYAGNADRSNIPNEVPRHNPDNCHNKDKRHFYLLWCGPDFHCDSWLDPPSRFGLAILGSHSINT